MSAKQEASPTGPPEPKQDPRDVESAKKRQVKALDAMKKDIQKYIDVYTRLSPLAIQIDVDDDEKRVALAKEIIQHANSGIPWVSDIHYEAKVLASGFSELVDSEKKDRLQREKLSAREKMEERLAAETSRDLKDLLTVDVASLDAFQRFRHIRDLRSMSAYLSRSCRPCGPTLTERSLADRACVVAAELENEDRLNCKK